MIVNPRTDLDIAWFEITLPVVDECDLTRTRLQHPRSRNDELPSQRSSDGDIHVHARLQYDAWITDYKPHAHGTCGHINLRKDLINAPSELASGICVDTDRRPIARFQAPNISLIDIRVHPDR